MASIAGCAQSTRPSASTHSAGVRRARRVRSTSGDNPAGTTGTPAVSPTVGVAGPDELAVETSAAPVTGSERRRTTRSEDTLRDSITTISRIGACARSATGLLRAGRRSSSTGRGLFTLRSPTSHVGGLQWVRSGTRLSRRRRYARSIP